MDLLFTFRGRISRMPFFLGSLAIGAIWLFLVTIGIIAAFGMADMDGAYGMDQLVRLFSAGAVVFLLLTPFSSFSPTRTCAWWLSVCTIWVPLAGSRCP